MAQIAELEAGISYLKGRFARAELEILESNRHWPERRVTYVVVGKADRRTDIVLSDEFLSDLPNTPEYQTAAESYAKAVAGRVKCGNPETFYCYSGVSVNIEFQWPVNSALVGAGFSSWLKVNVTDNSDGKVALYRRGIGPGSHPFRLE